jgi:hypothetical protein
MGLQAVHAGNPATPLPASQSRTVEPKTGDLFPHCRETSATASKAASSSILFVARMSFAASFCHPFERVAEALRERDELGSACSQCCGQHAEARLDDHSPRPRVSGVVDSSGGAAHLRTPVTPLSGGSGPASSTSRATHRAAHSRDGNGPAECRARPPAARLQRACSGPAWRVCEPSTCPRSHGSPGRMRRPQRQQVTSPAATAGASD